MSQAVSTDDQRELIDKLDPECNLFQCNECGHYCGDPRDHNWRGQCPECDLLVKFYRIVE